MDVSRETAPLVAEQRVAAAFPNAKAIHRYVDLLISVGVERGILGPREATRVWERHIFNCAAVAPAFPARCRVADVGSGAGLPGLVLALARPDLQLTLIEPLLRRSSFLSEVVAELDLGNVEVVRSRAEDVTGMFDAVTARAVARLPQLLTWCLPLCRPGGFLLALKGRLAEDELAAAGPELRRWSVSVKLQEYDAGVGPPTRAIRIESFGDPASGRISTP